MIDADIHWACTGVCQSISRLYVGPYASGGEKLTCGSGYIHRSSPGQLQGQEQIGGAAHTFLGALITDQA
jgi:hypothetical protein